MSSLRRRPNQFVWDNACLRGYNRAALVREPGYNSCTWSAGSGNSGTLPEPALIAQGQA